MNIIIVGAGPAGCYSGELLAKQGHNVTIYEKNKKIGSPVQCTGILSDYFSKIMNPSEKFVLNKVNKTRIHSPDGNFVEAKIKTNYVVCRKKFDNYLAKKAKKAGAQIKLKHCLKDIKENITYFGDKELKFDILIGADGPLSTVAKKTGLSKNRKYLIGTQVEGHLKKDNVVEFFPYIGNYAWVVPLKEKCRIGVVSYKKSKKLFDKFIANYNIKSSENQSGIIPVFDPYVKVQKKNIYLVGDAATFNKATSGGGINQSILSAKILGECIKSNKSYEKEWKKHMFNKLYVHWLLHNMMKRFSDKDWNNLIRTFKKPKMKKILENESRDLIVKMILKIAVSEPSLFKYIKKTRIKELWSYTAKIHPLIN
jgi:geranylgeranyl reductase family protein